MTNLDWMDNIACKGMDADLFFPSSAGVPGQQQAAEAARVCRTCPVQIECQQHRVATGATTGVWGGTAVRQKNAGPSSGGPHGNSGHGTDGRYRKHLRDGERPCAICLGAHSGRQSPNGRSKAARWTA